MKTAPSALKSLLIALALTATPALAQSGSAVTGSGTVNSVPKFSGATTVTNSSLTEVNGYVGIGTATPNAMLNLNGPKNSSPDGYNALRYDSLWGPISWGFTGNTANLWGTTLWSWQPDASINGGNLAFATGNGPTVSPNSNIRMLIDRLGNVGIGTSYPSAPLEIGNAVANTSIIVPNSGLISSRDTSGNVYSIVGTNNGNEVIVGSGNGNAWSNLHMYTGGAKRLTILQNGNVGIGTSTPTQALEVVGTVQLDGAAGKIQFPDGSSLASAKGLSSVTGGAGGSVGIGTNNPSGQFNVNGDNLLGPTAGNITLSHPTPGGASSIVFPSASNNGSDYGSITYYDQNSTYAFWGTSSENSALVIGTQNDGMNPYSDVVALLGAAGDVLGTSSHPTTLLVNDAGNVGIGTTNPQATLEVNGSVKLTSGSGASVTFQDNTVQTTAWNGTLGGGDYAESVDVTGDRDAYEAGDLIVIDDAETGKFNKASLAYSRMVAGVYSTNPGLIGRRTTANRPDKAAEVPMAMIGIVPTKVSAENGPIERGDLLVSSNTPGYAMKGTDRDRLMGAVIGKALAPLKSGTGVVEVLISLQ